MAKYIPEVIARSKSVAPDVLDALSLSDNTIVRLLIAENSNTSIETLVHLRNDPDKRVTNALAQRLRQMPAKNIDLWIFADSAEEIREQVATLPMIRPDTLRKLSNDNSAAVRSAVAHNPSTPADILARLAADKNSNVRAAVAKNRNLDIDSLITLALDNNSRVADAVASVVPKIRKAIPLTQMANGSRAVKLAVAENPLTPPAALATLATDPDTDIRTAVAENPNTDIETLILLAQDNNEDVTYSVADRVSSIKQASYLERLAAGAVEVKRAVAWNRRTPSETLASLAQNDDYEIQVGVAANRNTKAPILLQLASSRYFLARLAVARNKNIDKFAIEKLRNDPDAKIRGEVTGKTEEPCAAQLDDISITQVVFAEAYGQDATLGYGIYVKIYYVEQGVLKVLLLDSTNTEREPLLRALYWLRTNFVNHPGESLEKRFITAYALMPNEAEPWIGFMSEIGVHLDTSHNLVLWVGDDGYERAIIPERIIKGAAGCGFGYPYYASGPEVLSQLSRIAATLQP